MTLSIAARCPETGHFGVAAITHMIGIGKIGRAVAERMKGFGMTIVGYDPVLSREAAERIGLKLVTLDELYSQSDFITVHTPMTPETTGMLNRDSLAKCRKGVKLIT
jgi:D-3-phosphoglycerate dehydrogenase / 2-oxoglutarate reductase